MKKLENGDDTLLVDISDALSERDRVRFTVHTRTKLPQFAKPVLSVVRQHEEFIWLHDCLEDNDQYAGYIIPPPPPKPDFDSSREKLQRLGDGEANMTKEEFAKMKQELEAEYLAIFKKTVAMHEIFLQRLAAHEIFRNDNNFKIFLEYENELAVRCKSKKERLAGSISNIGKSFSDFVITTSQVAATTSASTSILAGHHPSPNRLKKQLQQLQQQQQQDQSQAANNHLIPTVEEQQQLNNGNTLKIDISTSDSNNQQPALSSGNSSVITGTGDGNNNNNQQFPYQINSNPATATVNGNNDEDFIDEQYFDKERLSLALYYNSIRETAIQADKATQLQKCLADNYLYISQQLVKLASIEIVPITAKTKDSSSFVLSPLPSLTMPSSSTFKAIHQNTNDPMAGPSSSSSASKSGAQVAFKEQEKVDDRELGNDDDDDDDIGSGGDLLSSSNTQRDDKNNLKLNIDTNLRDNSFVDLGTKNLFGGCANNQTSEGLKQLLLNVSDYLEQARKIETRIASDEDLKLTDTFLYYKRDTVAAQDLLVRRLRFLAEYETATRNLEKARQKGRTQMQYADVIQKQARENFVSISKLAKQELIDYKQRRAASFKKAFSELVELELKHLRSHSQLLTKCLDTCRGITQEVESTSTSNGDK